MNFRNRIQWFTILLICIVISSTAFPQFNVLGQRTSAIDEKLKTSILNATIQIHASVFPSPHPDLSPEQAQDLIQKGYQYVVAHGLGSVVSTGGGTVIITHNHWGDLLVKADLIEICDAQGKILIIKNGAQMQSLLHYQDAGTIILTAPEGLAVQPARLGDVMDVRPGDRVLVVHQNPDQNNQIEVIESEIKKLGNFESLPAWVVQSTTETLRKGDSGGGVWLDGGLIGNNWAVQTSIDWKFWTWQTIGPQKILTHSSYAAVYPM